MIVIAIIVFILALIGFKMTEEKGKIQDVFITIGGFAFILGIILMVLNVFFGSSIFEIITASEDTVYEILSFEQTVTPNDKRYNIKIDDNTTYILSESESNIEIDYQGTKPTTIIVTQNITFNYCTFNAEEKKIYKIY